MKYRCPHCGQPGFSFFAKADLVPRLKLVPEYAQGARCDVCRERAVYHARWGGRLGHLIGDAALLLALFGAFVLIANTLPSELFYSSEPWVFFVFGVSPFFVWGALLCLFKWLFCYLDKPARADYISADKFRFITDGAVRLWPRVRVGEIYLIRFPKRKKRDDGPYLIGMVTHVEKDGESQEVTIRVVKEYLMNAPLLEEELVLTTEKGFVLSGTVSHTYRLPSQE